MNLNMVRFFSCLAAVGFLVATGCAKKQKPDINNELGNTLSKDIIQDRDITLDTSGSDSGKIEGLYTVYFDFDRSSLSEESRGHVPGLVEI